MEYINTDKLKLGEKECLYNIWNSEYPSNISFSSIEQFDQYLESLIKPNHTLVYDQEKLLGWSCQFYREKVLWFLIILNSKVQGIGLGSTLLHKLKQKNNELFGWVVDHETYTKKNGDPYKSPLSFYLRNGFKVLEERFETPALSAIKIHWINKEAS